MALREVKHNRDDELNAENLRGGAVQPTCPAPFFIDPTLLFEGVPCPRDQFRNRVDHRYREPWSLSKLCHQGDWDHGLSVSNISHR
jgi:hypothetical protein